MGKPLPMALRKRVAAYVEEGHGHREAARHFRVSPRFVNNLMKLRAQTGSLEPRRQGHAVGRRQAGAACGVRAAAAGGGRRTDAGRAVRGTGRARGERAPLQCRPAAAPPRAQPQKKRLQASEQQRADIREARELWIKRRRRFFNKALARLIFIDETSTNTRLTKRTGWSPKGERYRTHAPFGEWHTQTFIAGLRCHGMIAPWIVDAPMNGRRFETLGRDAAGSRTSSPAMSSSSTMSASTRASGPPNWCANAAPGCCSCRHTRPISTRSRWPSQNSRRCCERRPPGPSTPSARRSATSATSSTQHSAETSSKQQDMRQINRDTL